MRRLIYLAIVFSFLLAFIPGQSDCYAAGSDPKLEVEWDYLSPHGVDNDINTVSLHMFTKFAESKTRSMYRGITVTRTYGDKTLENKAYDSSAVGIGPMYLIRDEKYHAGKLTAAVDMSGGIMVYNNVFPAGGRHYDFMWRIGPRLIYKFNENSSLNVGYMFAHVSNGMRTHNPGYDGRGISVGFVANF